MSTALLLAADSSDSSDDGSYVANEESESDDEIEEPAAPERALSIIHSELTSIGRAMIGALSVRNGPPVDIGLSEPSSRAMRARAPSADAEGSGRGESLA